MQKVWIATELFYPEETSTSYILTKVANKLTDKYEVEVVCGTPTYDTDSTEDSYFKVSEKIRIHRLKSLVGNKNNILYRVLKFIQLSVQIVIFLKKNLRSGDKLFIVTNPAPLIILCAWLKKFKKFEWIILVHDVFPENTIPAGIINSKANFVYRFLKKMFDRAYSTADRIIVLGRDMEKVMRGKISRYNRNTNIKVIENWGATHEILPLKQVKHPPLVKKFTLQYAGNMGRVQGLHNFLKCFKNSNNNDVILQLIGDGAVKVELQNFVLDNALDNVVFYGGYRRNEQNQILNSCDMALVTLASGMYGLGVPSKTYNILAAGIPLLYIGPKNSEIDLLIKDYSIGFSFEPEDTAQLTEFFKLLNNSLSESIEQMSLNARKLAECQYSEEIILNKFLHYI